MPRNRADVARSDKLDEILEAARARLLEGGYDALSVAELARELGVAQNAIYWYFPTKDHLLVAAVDRILHDVLSRKPRRGSVIDRVLWVSQRFHEVQELRLALRARARASEHVAAYERDVVSLLRMLLVNSLHGSVAAEHVEDTADAVMALCEGALLREMPARGRARVVRFGLERLLSG